MIAVLEWCLGLHIVPMMMTRSISIRKGQRTLGNLVAIYILLAMVGLTQFDVLELERAGTTLAGLLSTRLILRTRPIVDLPFSFLLERKMKLLRMIHACFCAFLVN